MLNKRISKAFGKKIYLLGVDKDGTKYWLEEPKWECNRYWGFGYIETYTDNRFPGNSADISSHQHADNFHSKWWKNYNYDDKQILVETTFNNEEGWELSELFAQFYFLREAAEMFNRGKAHVSDTIIPTWIDENKVQEINKKLIPMVTNRIIEILTPK